MAGNGFADPEAPARSEVPALPLPEPIDYERDPAVQPKRVLVIEDDVDIAHYLEGLFTGEGFYVTIGSDGPSGLERIGKNEFDLVVSEYLLPGLLGDEVFRRIRADARSRTLPILMLTSVSDPVRVMRAIEAGADDYILKPFDPIELTARARAAMRRRAT